MTKHEQEFDELFPKQDYIPIPSSSFPRTKKKKSFSKVIVILSVMTVMGYTAVHLYFSWNGIHIPEALTYSFFGMFGVELSALAWRTGIEAKEEYKTQQESIKYYEKR